MDKVYRFLGRVVVMVLIALTLGSLAKYAFSEDKELLTSSFTHEEIEKISPFAVIDQFTLESEKNTANFLDEATRRLVDKGVLVPSPYGLTYGPTFNGTVLSLIIHSPGGRVDAGIKIAQHLDSLRRNNILIHCYVSEAQSMAFYLMATQCHRVIAKRSIKLMQHRTYYPGKGYTASTYLTDLEMASAEADALGVNRQKWMDLTRKSKEDHVFTMDEIAKYQLVDEWME